MNAKRNPGEWSHQGRHPEPDQVSQEVTLLGRVGGGGSLEVNSTQRILSKGDDDSESRRRRKTQGHQGSEEASGSRQDPEASVVSRGGCGASPGRGWFLGRGR